VSITWGCDWDPATRKVYTTIPNLGLLDRIDYDTGQVEKRWIIGPGMRSVAYDQVRHRVYFTDFLRGYVLAFDEQSERIVDRWFVGRFSRWVRLTRDGHALLATGNLGIVLILLDG
jgi:DNA-binding beta-propeller fold protein YncE